MSDDFLADYERHLLAAAKGLAGASRADRRSRLRLRPLLAAAVLAAAIGALSLVVTSAPPSDEQAASPDADVPIPADGVQRPELSLLSRPATPADRELQAKLRPVPTSARIAFTNSDGEQVAAYTNQAGDVCLRYSKGEQSGIACTTAGQAVSDQPPMIQTAGGLTVGLLHDGPGSVQVTWSDGRTTTVPVTDNAFAFHGKGARTMRFQGLDGPVAVNLAIFPLAESDKTLGRTGGSEPHVVAEGTSRAGHAWSLAAARNGKSLCISLVVSGSNGARSDGQCSGMEPGSLGVAFNSGQSSGEPVLLFGTAPDAAATVSITAGPAEYHTNAVDDAHGIPGKFYVVEVPEYWKHADTSQTVMLDASGAPLGEPQSTWSLVRRNSG